MNYFNWNCKISTQSPGCGHPDICFTENNLLSFDWGLPTIDFTAMPLWSDSAELQGLFLGRNPSWIGKWYKGCSVHQMVVGQTLPSLFTHLYWQELFCPCGTSGLLFIHTLSSEMWYQSIAQRLQKNWTDFFFFFFYLMEESVPSTW